MLFSPQFNQFSPFTQPAFTAFSSVFQVRISQAFHVSLAFAPGLKGSQLTETNSTYILHNPSFPAYILHAAKPLPPPPDTLSKQASFVLERTDKFRHHFLHIFCIVNTQYSALAFHYSSQLSRLQGHRCSGHCQKSTFFR